MEKEEIRKSVREGYGKIARENASCCGSRSTDLADVVGKNIGYSEEEMKAVPEGANLGLGCGNPIAFASLKEGDTVLDLGSGAGFDCFLAAGKVGSKGKVIGVDMTPEMLEKARENARKGNYKNVEFRLGEIENLPAADNCADVVISNCVINLSPDKQKVFQEACRVLKPGGRLMVSDIVLLKPLPVSIRESIEAYVGCISGATMKNEYLKAIRKAGFRKVKIVDETSFPADCMVNDPIAETLIKEMNIPSEAIKDLLGSVLSVKVSGVKPQ